MACTDIFWLNSCDYPIVRIVALDKQLAILFFGLNSCDYPIVRIVALDKQLAILYTIYR